LYQIKHIYNKKSNLDFIEIFDSKKSIYAKIQLNQGGSLQELRLGGQELIKDTSLLTYDTTYASSILFPFANRVKDGRYEFDKKTYQLDINEKGLINALHGLVYNKSFEVINKKSNENSASVNLVYHEKQMSNGFPYTYAIRLEYVFTENTLDLNVEIKNSDSKTFPFTIGWHPYFLSSDLYNSSLNFNCNKKTVLDERNITKGISHIEPIEMFQIKDQSLDDCYQVNSNELTFLTPKYSFKLSSSEKDGFLQLDTPPHKNTIAIEPTTGVSDSLNNGIGLKTLQPNETYNINWNLKIDNI